ncbi:hypothetical protein [Microbulbifer sp. 2205BS26-8]|uniref:hypothetical protein n=1 Tax=Microbulbifer sp. 2205BS26-8 TaxID=3064386 RepID=UPI00273F7A67|nr:hypothetical protein [Microbulbifer sp. 2205BS26-8]MDP5210980.1 hypothetical protein [Microbulbifer sp. 2205BS26-8]
MDLKPTRIPKLLALAKGRNCVQCGNNEITTVAAHYQGPRSLSYGKGRGIKPHDAMAAHLCYRCHSEADSSALGISPEAHSARFLLLIITTQLHLFLEGRITARNHAQAFLLKLCRNASVLKECGEDELHRTACRLAQCWDSGEITITNSGAMVSSFVGVGP